MNDRLPMTPSGFETLKNELKRLKSVDRPENIQDIEEALAHGDLSENAEYHAAMERKAHIDARIRFDYLLPAVMEQIVTKFLHELEQQLAERHVTIRLTDAARRHLAKKGHDPKFGARPLDRVIQQEIKRPLTEQILFGQLERGGIVEVDEADGAIVLRYPDS